MHRISNVQRKEETKTSGFGAGCSAKSLWHILQASPTRLVKSRSNVFDSVEEFKPQPLLPPGMSFFDQRFEIFCDLAAI